MLNIRVTRKSGQVVATVIENYKYDGDRTVENRNNWKTLAAAEAVAAALGEAYVATDSGAHVSPRYDVITRPQVGDKVSYAFNGDSYPCGTITKMSAGPTYRRIETSTGKIFWRRRQSGAWVNDGTWSLVVGHINKRNPEF